MVKQIISAEQAFDFGFIIPHGHRTKSGKYAGAPYADSVDLSKCRSITKWKEVCRRPKETYRAFLVYNQAGVYYVTPGVDTEWNPGSLRYFFRKAGIYPDSMDNEDILDVLAAIRISSTIASVRMRAKLMLRASEFDRAKP